MKKAAAFWDSSAIVPLCTNQRNTPQVQLHYRHFSLVVWWSTTIEVSSGVRRLHRNQQITDQDQQGAFARLQLLGTAWREILPEYSVRDLAADALARHALSAADALQLAAALTWCRLRPARHTFLTADQRLAEAARSNGFSVIALL